MVDKRRLLGDTGEQLAAEQLVRSGLRIVARNWRGHSGELDLIAQEEAPERAAVEERKPRTPQVPESFPAKKKAAEGEPETNARFRPRR